LIVTAEPELENLSIAVDLHTHTGNAYDNRLTLTFDLLISGLVYARHSMFICRLRSTMYML